MKTLKLVLLPLLFALVGCRQSGTSSTEGYASWLTNLTNLNNFAVAPAQSVSLISTYDRTGGNNDWLSPQSFRIGQPMTVADLKGPGVINRFWLTGIPDEYQVNVSLQFDGEKTPRYVMPLTNLFGGSFPFIPPLAQHLSGAKYCYLPIPYEKSLKITLSTPPIWKDPRPYFQINYTPLPGRNIKSLPAPDRFSPADRTAIEQTARAWTSMASYAADAVLQCRAPSNMTVHAGANAILYDGSGSGTLQTLWLDWKTLDPEEPLDQMLLSRALVLRIYWDGATLPSVEAPLGDFFCNAIHRRQFASLPLARVADQYVCRFPMPFKKGMRIELKNDSSKSLRIGYGLSIGPGPATPTTRYFHATWRSAVGTGKPFSVLDAPGPGHYVGGYLVCIGMDGGWNILEGDEHIRVDDGAHEYFGTGLEDYFNGGWYYYGLFNLPLHGLVDKFPIRTSQYRFLLTDPIPFAHNFVMNWEFGHGNTTKGYMSSVAYWYADQPRPAGSLIPSLESRFPPRDPLSRYAIMAGLFELERLGYYDEARQRCLEYLAQNPDSPESAMIALREVAYREILEGYPAVKASYSTVKNTPYTPAIREQADLLDWFHQGTNRAILTASANGRYKVYWDGQLMLDGDQPLALSYRGIEATPGTHQITAEVIAPDRSGPYWLRVHVRHALGTFDSDETWLSNLKKPADWPALKTPGSDWTSIKIHGLTPFMSYWQFQPNALIAAQAGAYYIYPQDEWKPGRTVYFKKDVEICSCNSSP
jgi:hypothetical protein